MNCWTIPNGRDVRSFCSVDKKDTVLFLATHKFDDDARIDYIIGEPIIATFGDLTFLNFFY